MEAMRTEYAGKTGLDLNMFKKIDDMKDHGRQSSILLKEGAHRLWTTGYSAELFYEPVGEGAF